MVWRVKMKAVLEFNLPEDEYDFKLALNGSNFYSALFDIYNECRSYLKHSATSEEGIRVVGNIIDLVPETVFEIE